MKNTMRILAILLCALLFVGGCAPQQAVEAEPQTTNSVQAPVNTPAPEQETKTAASYLPGTYTGTATSMNADVTVEVTVSEDRIETIVVTDNMESPGIGSVAVEKIPAAIVEAQSLAVDSLTGATISSMAIKRAVSSALEEAGEDISALNAPIERTPDPDASYEADVIIVGGGGTGLSSSIAALEEGASVILIEKTGLLGGNSIVAGGFYNAPDPERQATYQSERSEALDSLIVSALEEKPVSEEHKALQEAVRVEFEEYLASDRTLFDSPNWFALQTWNGGDRVGDLSVVKVLAENALDSFHWLESMGAGFPDNVFFGGGALYPRSHQSVDPNGTGYINALTGELENREKYTVLMNTEAKSLIVENNRIVGVNAIGRDGNAVTLRAAKGVILATGGFAGNVELRQKYCEGEKWPNLGQEVRTTNVSGVTGDGIFMAEAAGANLVNMEQIQLLPYCNAQTGMLNDSTGTATVAEYIFLNKEGKRFVREDGRRDDMSRAILNQTESKMYMFASLKAPLEEMKTLGGQPVTYMIENSLSEYGYAETIEEAAEKLGCDAQTLRETITSFNTHASEKSADEFGRVNYSGTLGEGPFLFWARRPAAHHTMGGVEIDVDTHALRADGTVVEGLYCAGEITGCTHGANRIGGNAIAEFVTFGRIAGRNAALGK